MMGPVTTPATSASVPRGWEDRGSVACSSAAPHNSPHNEDHDMSKFLAKSLY